MSDFFLRFDIPKKTEFLINHSHRLTFLGSCFSNEISNYASQAGFHTLSNPFGTIYHPYPIAKNILDALNGNATFTFLKRDDLMYSWDASTKVNGKTEEELKIIINNLNEELIEQLMQPGFLFITFGSAFIYKLKSENRYVANCHKQPGILFDKEITSEDSIYALWRETLTKLRKLNPNLKVIFTVSPVRHIRDGLIENNHSKARLIRVIEQLAATLKVDYFPSYEIMIDELRDYRFYKEDRVHPSAEAIQYIWNQFSDLYFDVQTKNNIQEILKIRKRLGHRSNTESSLDLNLVKSMEQMKEKFPWINW